MARNTDRVSQTKRNRPKADGMPRTRAATGWWSGLSTARDSATAETRGQESTGGLADAVLCSLWRTAPMSPGAFLSTKVSPNASHRSLIHHTSGERTPGRTSPLGSTHPPRQATHGSVTRGAGRVPTVVHEGCLRSSRRMSPENPGWSAEAGLPAREPSSPPRR